MPIERDPGPFEAFAIVEFCFQNRNSFDTFSRIPAISEEESLDQDHNIHTRHGVDRYMFFKVVQDNAQPNISDELLKNARIISQESALGSQGAPSYRVFSMEELKKATEKFVNQHCSVKALLKKSNNNEYCSIPNSEPVQFSAPAFVVTFCLLGIFEIQELQVKALPEIDHVLEEKLNRRQITTCGQLRMISKEQQFNEEEIQVVSYPDMLFADMKSKPLSDASLPNMDVVINAPVSGGISLMPSSLSQVNTSVFQQLPEEFLAKLKYTTFKKLDNADTTSKTKSCCHEKIVNNEGLLKEDVETVLDTLMNFCNQNGDKVNFDEVELVEVFDSFDETKPSLEEVKEAFDVFDENGDGYIDANELNKVIFKMGFLEFSVLDCQRMIIPFDENKDGKIEFVEFVKLMEHIVQ
ncbi:putative calcium-binding protein CML47 [Capsicum chinense]|nr:putative calcium-binding protein CML47 [Capsicum chinense]